MSSSVWSEFVDCVWQINDKIDSENEHASDLSTYDRAALICTHQRIVNFVGRLVPGICDETDTVRVLATESENAGFGRVFAVRFDQTDGPKNLKSAVFCGLLVNSILTRRLVRGAPPHLIDAGNMNSGYALKHLCEALELRGTYVMSRYFPQDMRRSVESHRLRTEVAPRKKNVSVEREFYSYLVELVRRMRRQRGSCFSPFHAKHGLSIGSAFGRLMSSTLDRELAKPDCDAKSIDVCVSTIGSGTSFKWLQELAISYSPRIVVPEHRKSPIYSRINESLPLIGSNLTSQVEASQDIFSANSLRRPSDGRITSSILGPHFEEENPFARDLSDAIDLVSVYSDSDWISAARCLSDQGHRPGNSSVVNLMVTARFAREGLNVLTAIYEPDRWYYHVDQCHSQLRKDDREVS